MRISKEDLTKQIEQLLERIIWANDCLLVHKQLNDCRETYLDEMNYSPGFFSVASISILHEMYITVAKLFDADKDSLSVVNILNTCEQNQNYFHTEFRYVFHCAGDEEREPEVICTPTNFPAKITDAKSELARLQPVIKNLTARRDKYYAHIDKKYVLKPNELWKNAPLTYNDVDTLLEYAGRVCNMLQIHITPTRSTTVTHHSNTTDLHILLDFIQRNKNEVISCK
ncbi:MAG: hypothetical protein FWB88_01040 [Defluviitaleaceae bacterium]|nr:hypothetical protein [Defluviitaleaceae bacterium]MCL2238382.1 hypothetical protein [Defluviitaleaceae bacterium]